MAAVDIPARTRHSAHGRCSGLGRLVRLMLIVDGRGMRRRPIARPACCCCCCCRRRTATNPDRGGAELVPGRIGPPMVLQRVVVVVAVRKDIRRAVSALSLVQVQRRA